MYYIWIFCKSIHIYVCENKRTIVYNRYNTYAALFSCLYILHILKIQS